MLGFAESGPKGGAMMDSFELSKIAGAVLAALLLIVGPKTVIDIWRSGHGADKPGYTLPVPGDAPTEAATVAVPAQPAGFDPASVVAALGAADPENGKGLFRKCGACHSAAQGAATKAGPNLWGVVGRPKGSLEFGYSAAMKEKGGEWSYADLASFLYKPKGFVKGTKMIFPGVKDSTELADLIAYMRTLADTPAPLPN
jgi:cytochrome c